LQLYRGGQFYWWRKPEYPEKITDLPKVTDKHYFHVLFKILKHIFNFFVVILNSERDNCLIGSLCIEEIIISLAKVYSILNEDKANNSSVVQ
jgi:hypothetical protein